VINEKTVAEDSIVYFVNKQMQHKLKNIINFNTWYENAIQINQAIILHSTNYDDYAKMSFDTVMMSGAYGSYGFYIYCNVTSDVYDNVEDEFYAILKSMTLETQLPQDEIIQVERIEKDKKIHRNDFQ
jgi:predicted GNAT superfamily acetyltransferase